MATPYKHDDDDYVAKLLAEDAKRSSLRYASVGLSALLPKQPTGSALRPNTRFLKHLVQEADSHNAALKKKEELEARIRLREAYGSVRHDRPSRGEQHRSKRQRTDRDVPERVHKSHRRHHADSKSDSRHDRHRHGSRDEVDRDRSQRRDVDRSVKREHRKRRSRDVHTSSCSDSEEMNSRRSQRKRHTEPRQEGRTKKEHGKHFAKPRSCSPGSDDFVAPKRGRKSSETRSRHRNRDANHNLSQASESESREDLAGFLTSKAKNPESIQIRGRGAHRKKHSTSNIDAHFSSNYDPSRDDYIDSEPDDGVQDDWDMALEALRDRTMWQRKQADRMREAGWKEEEISKWERTAPGTSGTRETDISQVKWTKKGESREWDKGKESIQD